MVKIGAVIYSVERKMGAADLRASRKGNKFRESVISYYQIKKEETSGGKSTY